jgi:elongation factor G
MKVYDAASLRNVALVGHSGSGKTQLVSALLFDAGAVNRLGKVDEGTTVTDYDEEEIARKHTLSASVAYAEWNKTKINFIDTPGMANFLSDARAALRVADAALVVVDAVSGVEVSTEKVWEAADELSVPRIVVLNRFDRERASLERSLESLHGVFGRSVVPIQMPIGEEKTFKGIVDLVAMKAYTFADGKPSEGPVPGDVEGAAQKAREALIEMVAEADDALMEKFFDAGTLTQDELIGGLKRGVAAAKIYPLVLTSSIANIGIQPLLDAIVTYAPSPADRPLKAKNAGGEMVDILTKDGGPVAAFVWKTVADPFAGRITLFRVLSGTLKSDATVHNVTKDTQERLGHLLLAQGKSQTNVGEIKAGDIGAVAKLKETQTSDVFGDKGAAAVPPITFPEPVISYAIEPKSRGDEEKISTALHRLQEEDPTINYTRDAQTKELLLAGQGQSHIEVTVAKLKRRFGVEVTLKLPRSRTARRSRRRSRRTAATRSRRAATGSSAIARSAAAAAGQRLPVRERHFGGSSAPVRARDRKGDPGLAHAGFLAGYPTVDFKATVFDGSYPRRGLERNVVQDGGVARVQGWHVARAPDAPRAGDERGGLRAVRLRGRSDGRSEQPPRTHRRHGHARRVHHHPREGADVGDADLRAAPHVSHRRPRVVSHGIRSLRRGPAAPPRQDHRRIED